MKSRNILKTLIMSLVLVVTLLVGGNFVSGHHIQVNASQADAYDISQYQGRINDRQAQGLKNEVKFVILRAQAGSSYQDAQFQHSMNEMNKNNVPYGVYSYSLYHNNQQARNEASTLYNRAPQANFYINDIEQNNAGSRIVSATNAWADQMKRLTTKPVVLYSGASFINQYLRPALKHYDAVWVAQYYYKKPIIGHKYDLWQYSSTHYSKALGQKLDASKLMGNKPLSFWIGSNGNGVVQPIKTRRAKSITKVTPRTATFNLRQYHHEMTKIGRKFKRGDYRLSRTEKKAMKIYQTRHGHAFRG
ncbi:GH25 family lysozyme [Acetilactobacillus jinshanensis]|uniref:1,4-beta-N-acetylmuramidase n=1 Tax=Acetilactobacillus jinshanensis TaxID=1720083 RepID=A0A4P6ZJZ3_9LACO|nr:GH25 family lysozyme [Acetilactobacillus jinshanensis]QBP17732.1 hypothetical protein ELX58_00760 [Acetilactobacillus jinshanensis]URL60594.1 hypothetical protein HGK75_00770 [uncultured bacterium]